MRFRSSVDVVVYRCSCVAGEFRAITREGLFAPRFIEVRMILVRSVENEAVGPNLLSTQGSCIVGEVLVSGKTFPGKS